ncbi:MAG: hypothetical protein B7Y66_12645, partial [Sphingobacteriia bacterium 35-36-14]
MFLNIIDFPLTAWGGQPRKMLFCFLLKKIYSAYIFSWVIPAYHFSIFFFTFNFFVSPGEYNCRAIGYFHLAQSALTIPTAFDSINSL